MLQVETCSDGWCQLPQNTFTAFVSIHLVRLTWDAARWDVGTLRLQQWSTADRIASKWLVGKVLEQYKHNLKQPLLYRIALDRGSPPPVLTNVEG